jgi:hypothetical protein
MSDHIPAILTANLSCMGGHILLAVGDDVKELAVSQVPRILR